jgi:hypothetical protein
MILIVDNEWSALGIAERLAIAHQGVASINVVHGTMKMTCNDGTEIYGEPTCRRGSKWDEIWSRDPPRTKELDEIWLPAVGGQRTRIHFYKELDDESNCNI